MKKMECCCIFFLDHSVIIFESKEIIHSSFKSKPVMSVARVFSVIGWWSLA